MRRALRPRRAGTLASTANLGGGGACTDRDSSDSQHTCSSAYSGAHAPPSNPGAARSSSPRPSPAARSSGAPTITSAHSSHPFFRHPAQQQQQRRGGNNGGGGGGGLGLRIGFTGGSVGGGGGAGGGGGVVGRSPRRAQLVLLGLVRPDGSSSAPTSRCEVLLPAALPMAPPSPSPFARLPTLNARASAASAAAHDGGAAWSAQAPTAATAVAVDEANCRPAMIPVGDEFLDSLATFLEGAARKVPAAAAAQQAAQATTQGLLLRMESTRSSAAAAGFARPSQRGSPNPYASPGPPSMQQGSQRSSLHAPLPAAAPHTYIHSSLSRSSAAAAAAAAAAEEAASGSHASEHTSAAVAAAVLATQGSMQRLGGMVAAGVPLPPVWDAVAEVRHAWWSRPA